MHKPHFSVQQENVFIPLNRHKHLSEFICACGYSNQSNGNPAIYQFVAKEQLIELIIKYKLHEECNSDFVTASPDTVIKDVLVK